jgi:hypothetical protein
MYNVFNPKGKVLVSGINILFALLACISCASSDEKEVHADTVSTRVQSSAEVTGNHQGLNVLVEYKNLDKYFYASWFDAPDDLHFEMLKDSDKIKNVEKAVYSAFKQYPLEVLNQNIGAVVVLKKLNMHGLPYGGTYICNKGNPESSVVYLVLDDSISKEGLYSYIIDAFNHEFSSILMKNYDFPKEAWKSANGEGFEYKNENDNGGYKALKNGEFGREDNLEELYRKGILSQYALSDLEEDFNVYSGMIMTYPNELQAVLDTYPVVKKKVKIWIDFYKSINNKFEETTVFKTFGDL